MKNIKKIPWSLSFRYLFVSWVFKVILITSLPLSFIQAETLELTGTIRDFRDTHQDFQNEGYANSYSPYRAPTVGLVKDTLGHDKKPILKSSTGKLEGGPRDGEALRAITNGETFSQWFNDVNGINQSKPFSLVLEKQGDKYVYDSAKTPMGNTGSYPGFFPLDQKMFGNQGRVHNYHFSLELHSQFTYTGGETFDFSGDDDVWVYIDNKLAVDLGGIHTASYKSINLDSLSLTIGETYDLDFFFVERKTSQSNFKLTTTIKLSATGNGTLRYADSGKGKYKDRILFMDWKDSALEDGIQEGDTVEFDIPEQSCLANGKLTATFSNIVDLNNIAGTTLPTDMKTWDGSGFYKLYDTAGLGEAIYTREYILQPNQESAHFKFTIDWKMELAGETVKPDIFLIDAESTTEHSEQIDAITNGGYWSVVENAQSNTYEVDGLGTQQVSIKNTEHPNPHEVEGWSPLLLSKGMTQTTIDIKNFDSSHGKEGVAFALLAPCDRGDAPASYGDAGHAFFEEAISSFKTELGLKFSTKTPYLGATPPDSERYAQTEPNDPISSLGDDVLTDFYDKTRNDDEDGVAIPPLALGSNKEISVAAMGEGFLQAWVDWNADGDFTDEGEQVQSNMQLTTGVHSIALNVPNDAKVGETYARFRFATEESLAPTGYAKDGEVEDYAIEITEQGVCTIDMLAPSHYTASALSTNSPYLKDTTRIYQAKFNPHNWQGKLIAYDLITNEDDGNINTEVWEAGALIPRNGRKIFTYNPLKTSNRGQKFRWGKLNKQQKLDLRAGGNVPLGKKRAAWLQGSDREEGVAGKLRKRNTVLGDIIHSSINYKSNVTDYGYKQLSGVEGTQYASFLAAKKTTMKTVFVGANDGMLHAFNAENNTDAGKELFSYIPNQIYSKLPKISDKKYGCQQTDCIKHEYLVDGPITLGDAYFSSELSWKSVLVGTLGLGGKGIFALNITNPNSFKKEDVLWELSDTQAPDQANVFANHMGYSLPAASIVKMKNGKWVAVIGNGYDSLTQQAVLFIVDIETGKLLKTFNTNTGSDTLKNGLSTPTPVDSNGDYMADMIYAGDLLGNLWAFDVSSNNSDDWHIRYGTAINPKPLFKACESATCDSSQVITAAPQVGRNPSGGLMVYFGTGKYFDVQDNMFQGSSPAVNTFYGIHDKGSPVSRSQLVQQEILQASSVSANLLSRVTSTNKVDYSKKRGWYMDLVSPEGQPERGERVISQALLRGGRIIFTTMTPPQNDCVLSGTSWLMEFNALDGKRLSVVPFDTNNDKQFNSEDNVDYQGDSTIISGVQKPSLGVVFSQPAVVSHSSRIEGKYLTGSSGSVGMFRESASRFSGRMSWRQLH